MRGFCKLLFAALAMLIATATADDVAAARAAGDYLARICGEEGFFVYRLDVRNGRILPGYNWLRHAGTIYSLCQLHQATGEAVYLETAARAARRLRAAMEPVEIGGRTFVVPVCRPAVTGERQTVVKTGAAALAAIAFWHLDAARPEPEYAQELEWLGDYLRFVQEPSGLIRSKYDLISGEYDEWRSNYYPGQTLLALALLEQRYPKPENRTAMLRLLVALANQWAARNQLPPGTDGFDHWGMLGLADAWPQVTDEELAAVSDGAWSRERLLREALAYCGSELFLVVPGGTFRVARMQLTPTTCRLEGILAIRDLYVRFAPDPTLPPGWAPAIEHALAFVRRFQITPEAAAEFTSPVDLTGAFRNAIDPLINAGAIVQIDFSQHAISALLAGSKE